MNISLSQRTEQTVRIFFIESRKGKILENLPQKVETMEEAMEDYRSTLRPEASNYGRTILVDGEYIGDVWCYCMNREKSPGAMLAFCIFNESCWSKGIATQAVMMFLNEVKKIRDPLIRSFRLCRPSGIQQGPGKERVSFQR